MRSGLLIPSDQIAVVSTVPAGHELNTCHRGSCVDRCAPKILPIRRNWLPGITSMLFQSRSFGLSGGSSADRPAWQAAHAEPSRYFGPEVGQPGLGYLRIPIT